MQRAISLDVYDYAGHSLCSLYNSKVDMVGQATDVYVHTERNGFKELRFNLPSTCEGEKNYRLAKLVSDYRIRLREVKTDGTVEIDWFLISESKVTHSNFSTNYEIRAGHISQLLNTKNLDLEFSDEEGNNTGTIKQIATTILEGTGWHLGNVATFYEEDKYNMAGKEKVRSFTASAKTGAFKMMNDLCEMFDAKPIYHGEGTYMENGAQHTGRTVDIIPMNPFSEKLEAGVIPPDLDETKVIELYYDKNVTDIARTLNTDALVTVLSAYGSYGDRNGMASLQTAEHAVISFPTLNAGEYRFVFKQAQYYFTVPSQTANLKWSSLDPASRSYVYNGTALYKVYKDPSTTTYTTINIDSRYEYIQNQVPYVMDFSYYQKVGLFTDAMLLKLAQTQTELPAKHIAAKEASIELSDMKEELAQTASAGEGFLMLDISDSDIVNTHMRLTLNKSTYSDGVIYRSDYDEAKRNRFTWYTAKGIKLNGEAINGTGAVVYIVHQGNPTTWEKTYVKALGNLSYNYYRDSLGSIYQLSDEQHYDYKEARSGSTYFPPTGTANIIYVADKENKQYVWLGSEYKEIVASPYYYGLNEFDEPDTITLWATSDTWHSGDKVYLFSADSIAGVFGPREDAVFANRKSIEDSIKVSTETYPIYFINDSQSAPAVDACLNGYGWYYKSHSNTFAFGDLYFCWGKNGENGWSRVYVSNDNNNPEAINIVSGYNYYYSLKRSLVYKAESGSYKPINKTVDEKAINNAFAAVVDGCINQEYLTKGVRERYNFNDSQTSLPIGNYAFKNEYNNYWLFTTDMVINNPSLIHYIPADKVLWQDNSDTHVLKAVEYSFRSLDFPKPNEMVDTIFVKMGYANQTFTPEGNKQVSNNIYVHDNTSYQFSLPSSSIVVCFDENQNVLHEYTSSPFTTPNHTTHVRIVANSIPTSSHYLRVTNYNKTFFVKNTQYTILSCTGTGERFGLNYLMDKFIDLAHQAYEVKLPVLKQAQQDITDMRLSLANTIGDMYREGYWQENSYSEGDEDKLYLDALDNLVEISHPQATYDITFLDLYGSDDNLDAKVKTDWPDIDINYAVHLVDTDIDTNRWAYIDSIDKCYDQPWNTKIEVNTRLSMIGQQSFTDVLARIAEVANETKAKQTIYGRAEALGTAGQIAADRLEGLIKTNRLYILGGTSNWYTDAKGNIIFEDTDGNSAMMLTGRGLMISNSKSADGDWDWRTALSGKGFNCDVIATGEFSAKHIIAGTITTDKLSSAVGQELEIGSNKALALYATVDGTRPVDGLETKHPNPGDSYIIIAAKNGNTDAHIDIASGGKVNLYGGSEVNIESGGKLNLTGATMNIKSSGKIVLDAGTSLEINTGNTGVFTVNSPNFSIQKNNQTNNYDVTITGNITTTGGKIAGFTIGKNGNIDYMYTGSMTSLASTSNGVYIGTNGISIAGGKFKMSADGNTTSLNIAADNITIGTGVTLGSRLTSIDDEIDDNLKASIVETVRVYKTGSSSTTAPTLTPSNATTVWTSTADSTWSEKVLTIDTTNKYLWSRNRYKKQEGKYLYGTPVVESELSNVSAAAVLATNIANGTTPVPYVSSTGITISGNRLDVTSTGSLNVAANGAVNITNSSGNDAVILNKDGISIASGADIAVVAGGTITIGSAGNSFVIGATSGTGARAYIYNGVTSMSDTTHYGIYMGTDGISIGKGSFKAYANGTLSLTGDVTATRFTLAQGASPLPASYVSGLTNAGVAYRYAVSNSGTTVPSSGWSTTRPSSVSQGQYVWTEIKTTALNGTVTTEYACEYYAKDGTSGSPGADGGYVSKIEQLYYAKNTANKPSKPSSKITQSGDVMNAWTLTCPTWASGYTYYRCDQYTWTGRSDSVTMSWSDVYADYGLTLANTEAMNAANTVEPFTHDGLSYGTTWGGVSYGVTLSNANDAKPMLIGSNSGITIAKSAATGDGAAVVINKDGIKMHATTFTLTTSKSNAASTTNALDLSTAGIKIYSGAKIEIKSGASFTVESNNFSIDTSGNVSVKGTIEANSTIACNISATNIVGGTLTLGGSNNQSGTLSIKNASNTVIGSWSNTGISATAGSIGGWTIGQNAIYNGTNSLSSDTAGVYLGTTGIRLVGGSTRKFLIDTDATNGKVEIIEGMNSLSSTADGLYLNSTSGIALGGGKFKVTTAGFLTATSGKLANWSIGENQLNAGSGTGYVALNSNNTLTNPNAAWNASTNDWVQPFALWCGNSTAASAPFRVRRDGKLYIDSLMVWDDAQSKYVEVDFSRDFSSAVAYSSGSWSGETFTATVSFFNGKISKRIQCSTSIDVDSATVTRSYAPLKTGLCNVRVKLGPGDSSIEENSVPIDATVIWDAAVDTVGVDTFSFSGGKAYANLSNSKTFSANLPDGVSWSLDNIQPHWATASVTIGGKTYSQSFNRTWING